MSAVAANHVKLLIDGLWALYEPFRTLRDVTPPPGRLTSLQRDHRDEAASQIGARHVGRRVTLPVLVRNVDSSAIASDLQVLEERSHYDEDGSYRKDSPNVALKLNIHAEFPPELHRNAVALCTGDAIVISGTITRCEVQLEWNSLPDVGNGSAGRVGAPHSFGYYPSLKLRVSLDSFLRCQPVDTSELFAVFVERDKSPAQLKAEAETRHRADRRKKAKRMAGAVSCAVGLTLSAVVGEAYNAWVAFGVAFIFLMFWTSIDPESKSEQPLRESIMGMSFMGLVLGTMASCVL